MRSPWGKPNSLLNKLLTDVTARAEQAKIILNDLVTKILRIFGWDNGN
jgi:hypothetical protein